MASTSLTASPEPSPSVPPSTVASDSTTSFDSSTTDSGTPSAFPAPSTVSSDSSVQSTPTSSADTTNSVTSTDTSSDFSSLSSGASAFPSQTSTTPGQTQATSSLSSVTTSVDGNSVPPLTLGGSASATSTQISSSGNSFFRDHSAVTGTFVVVGLVAAALVAHLCYVWRRRLQRRNRGKRFKTITWRRGQGSRAVQQTMSILSDSTVSSQQNYRTHEGEAVLHSIHMGEIRPSSISVPAVRVTAYDTEPPFDGLFGTKDHISRDLAGTAVTTDPRSNSPVPSQVPSSPSIYPPSLPPMETESNLTGTTVYSMPFLSPPTSPPPRPPREKRPPPPPSGKPTASNQSAIGR